MLSVAIVTFNCHRTIAGTLNSLVANIPHGFQPRLIIVDNNSDDDTLHTLRKYADAHEFIHLIRNNTNVGFARAHNQALSAVESRYHATCNPNIIFSSDIFTPLVEFIQNRPQIGLSCPEFINPDGTLQPLNRRHPSVLDFSCDAFYPHRSNLFSKSALVLMTCAMPAMITHMMCLLYRALSCSAEP
jgi:hypothetical protein